jgi:hypothetical protein
VVITVIGLGAYTLLIAVIVVTKCRQRRATSIALSAGVTKKVSGMSPEKLG